MSKKTDGQYMTPQPLIDIILDEIGFDGVGTIMEPSFGDGNFLVSIVKRMIDKGITDFSNVYGIEKDKQLYDIAIKRLNELVGYEYDWKNLRCADTLSVYTDYIGKFDYVVGNPPFVRIHNMNEEYRELRHLFDFTSGMTDLYIIFYDMGLSMLNEKGMLGYVSANSFLKNTSQIEFRNYLIRNTLVKSLHDFNVSKIFDASVYVCICILDKQDKDSLTYYSYDMYNQKYSSIVPYFYMEEMMDKPWILGSADDIVFYDNNQRMPYKIKDIAVVQNGVSTNKNNVYILHVDRIIDGYAHCGGQIIEANILKRCCKCSAYNGNDLGYMIFPYVEDGIGYRPMTEAELMQYPCAYQYLLSHKEELMDRDMENSLDWFLFARSQGLKTMHQKKIVLKTVFSHGTKIVPYILDEDIIVYSGLYITGDLDKIYTLLCDDDFSRYASFVGNDKTGGYKSITTKMIQNYGFQ